jgi:hypothetical protein
MPLPSIHRERLQPRTSRTRPFKAQSSSAISARLSQSAEIDVEGSTGNKRVAVESAPAYKAGFRQACLTAPPFRIGPTSAVSSKNHHAPSLLNSPRATAANNRRTSSRRFVVRNMKGSPTR